MTQYCDDSDGDYVYRSVEKILEHLKKDYQQWSQSDVPDPRAPFTERDAVAEIYCRLKDLSVSHDLYVHCEVKPYPFTSPKIIPDISLIKNLGKRSWTEEANEIHAGHDAGSIESRFSAVPVEFFHAALEIKIQSNFSNAKKDIDKLNQLRQMNPRCNCFLVLLNARGKCRDHEKIIKYGQDKGIGVIEYTRNSKHFGNHGTEDGALPS